VGWGAKLQAFGDRLVESVETDGEKALRDLGQAFASKLKDYIRSNAVVPPTIRTASGITLIDTGAYVNAIAVRVVRLPGRGRKGSGKAVVRVVLPPREQKLALWLEYGTSKMPARPHWQPVFERFKNGPEVRHVVGLSWISVRG
jgi:hypothetical protein